jgi:hypothetical protein
VVASKPKQAKQNGWWSEPCIPSSFGDAIAGCTHDEHGQHGQHGQHGDSTGRGGEREKATTFRHVSQTLHPPQRTTPHHSLHSFACRLTWIPDAHPSELTVTFLLIFSAQLSAPQHARSRGVVRTSSNTFNRSRTCLEPYGHKPQTCYPGPEAPNASLAR